jgi:hypothetical protein
MAPYLISFTNFAQDRGFNRRAMAHFERTTAGPGPHHGPQDGSVTAHFADHFSNLNQVLRRLRRGAPLVLASQRTFRLITCDDVQGLTEPEIRRFDPIGQYQHPDYPNHRLFFPSLMELLDYCYSRKVTHVHSASTGPVGLSALAVARILNLPVYGTCQHALAECFPFLGADESAGEILDRFSLWYYDQLDRIYVFSAQDEAELLRMGVPAEKIRLETQFAKSSAHAWVAFANPQNMPHSRVARAPFRLAGGM